MVSRFKWEGADEVVDKLEEMKERYAEAVAAAVYERLQGIIGLSQRMVPVDTGRLRASAFVTSPMAQGTALKFVIGYGTEYAVFVHEDTDATHNVGESKFLQKAVDRRSADFLDQTLKAAKEFKDSGVSLGSIQQHPTRPRTG